MMLVLQACRMQGLCGHGGCHPDFKGKQCMAVSKSLQAVPEKVIHEAVQAKPELQWIPEDVGGDARNVKFPS
jgi:hypothetical protein